MHKNMFTVILLLGFTTVYSQPTHEGPTSPAAIRGDLLLFLKPGKHAASLIDLSSKKMEPREMELSAKMTKGMQQNFRWFTDSAKYYIGSTIYFEKPGLTRSELDELEKISADRSANRKMVLKNADSLEIFKSGNSISFKGLGSLGVLDSLRLDLDSNTLQYKNVELIYSNTIGSKDSSNKLGGVWSGYEFRGPRNEEEMMATITDPKQMTYTSIDLQVGYMKATGKTLLFFMAQKYDKGRAVLNVILPILFE